MKLSYLLIFITMCFLIGGLLQHRSVARWFIRNVVNKVSRIAIFKKQKKTVIEVPFGKS